MGGRRAGAGPDAGTQGARFLRRTAAALALLLVVAGAGCGGRETGPRAAIGEPAPAFLADDLDGKPLSLAEYRGKVVLLNFWASWCGPCRDEFPLLRSVHGGDVAVLGVVYDDEPDDARAFMREHGATWRSVEDDGSIATAYGAGPGIPVTWVIDRDGVARATHYGELRRPDLDRLLPP